MSQPLRILGISAYYHDSAAALLEDGRIVAAAQEERFTRIKGDSAFPHHAIACCLDTAGIDESELDYVVFYENPLTKFERLLTTYHLTAPRSFASFFEAFPSWLTEKVWLENEIAREMGIKKRIYFCDHHLSHAASAFFPSPFERAAMLTIDGVGEWSTTTWGVGDGNRIELREQIRFPNSWGLLYSAFTYYTGFKINSGEYKLMGLAPYGQPRYADRILDRLLHLGDDGSIVLNQAYFDYSRRPAHDQRPLPRRSSGDRRASPSRSITQREMDLAASVQVVLDEAVLRMARHVRERTGLEHLVLAGGVALNVVSIGRLARAGRLQRTLGAARVGRRGQRARRRALDVAPEARPSAHRARSRTRCRARFWGSEIAARPTRTTRSLEKLGAVWDVSTKARSRSAIARAIAAGKVVARGARACGVRPALARRALDPRRRAAAADAVAHESEDQVPRELPALRPDGARGGRARLLRYDAGEPVHAARLSRSPSAAAIDGGRRAASSASTC